MKKLSLRTFMVVQAVVAFCIPAYYHLMVTYRVNSNGPVWVVIILLAAVSWLKRNSDGMDEYAKRTLQLADALCLKAAFVLMGILVFPFLLLDGVSPYLTGYLLTASIFILVLLRTIVFCWIDKNGMEA